MQWAALGGLAIIACYMVGMQFAGQALRDRIGVHAAAADIRARDVHEMLAGIRAVKLRGWEPRFEQRVRQDFEDEERAAGPVGDLLAASMLLSNYDTSLMSLVTISIYTAGMHRHIAPDVLVALWTVISACARARLLPCPALFYPHAAPHPAPHPAPQR